MSRTWAVAVLLLPGLLLGAQAAKRFRDVMHRQRTSSAPSGWIPDWSPDSNSWDEKRYPAWGDGDSRWNNCWKGGKVVALVTSDSPALVGSNVTFAVNLQYPRCQKEDDNGDIVYDQSVKCRNESSLSAGEFVYNWTQWLDYCDSGNCFNGSAGNFPDGRPFPPHHDWRRKNFIYVFHTLGQYFQLIGGSSAILSINTTNITVGTQLMEVSVYRRGRGHHTPVTKASGAYVVTDEIPFFVNISQKNDRNTTDQIFIKDSPISFAVKIHDPSHYLSTSVISYDWSFGDGSGAFVSNNPLTAHNYTREGNFSLNLTIKAAIPGPCRPVIPTTYAPTTTRPIPTTILPTNITTNATDVDDFLDIVNATTELVTTTVATTTVATTTAAVECVIHRYGYYTSKITIVEGIVEMSILQMTSVQVSAAEVDAIFDFVVTCQGSIPKNACTVISDSACMVPQDMVCDPVEATTDECLLTLRRSFSEPGTYCVNISLSDDASLALASTMLAVKGVPGNARTVEGVLLTVGFLVVLAAVITVLLYKRYKQYKPIDGGEEEPSDGGRVYFSNMKAVFVPRNNEKRPLLKGKAGVV